MPAPADNSTPTGALHLAPTSDASFMATDLAKSGLTVADVAGLGWHNTPDGYAIPFRDPGSGETLKTPKGKAFARTRVAKPGTGPKYLSPTGSTPFPYVLPAVHAALVADPCTPVVLTEGEKKAVRATLAGFPTIGLSGIDCWSEGKGSSTLHKLLSRYVATGRLFVMIYDSDGTLPAKAKNFDRSAGRFASAVERLGARFRRAFVPSGPDGAKQGLDDYLQAGATVDDLRRLVSRRFPPA